MPRTRRSFGTNGLNHCIIRGIDRGNIFYDTQDRKKFIKEMKKYKEKNNIKIGTYALMQNHVHFIIKGNDSNIPDFFKGILVSYSSYFNKKYERVGHLFENRYKNKIIDTEKYLKNVIKYIHYNPEKAGICRFDKYLWSGYNEILSEDSWLDKEVILMYYSDDDNEAKKLLKKEHLEGLKRYYEDYVEFEIVNKLSDEQVKQMIDNKIRSAFNESKDLKNIISSTNEKRILKEVLDVKGVSISQINRITGINRRLLSKIKNKKC